MRQNRLRLFLISRQELMNGIDKTSDNKTEKDNTSKKSSVTDLTEGSVTKHIAAAGISFSAVLQHGGHYYSRQICRCSCTCRRRLYRSYQFYDNRLLHGDLRRLLHSRITVLRCKGLCENAQIYSKQYMAFGSLCNSDHCHGLCTHRQYSSPDEYAG